VIVSLKIYLLAQTLLIGNRFYLTSTGRACSKEFWHLTPAIRFRMVALHKRSDNCRHSVPGHVRLKRIGEKHTV
jgi:hypothetical protein